MNRPTLSVFGLICALVILPGAASALSVSIDADPTTPGIQSTVAVGLGDEFAIDIVIQDVVAPQSITGFEFSLGFDSSVLTALNVSSGGYLNSPSLEIISLAGDRGVLHAEFSFSRAGATGDGVLASVVMQGTGGGTSDIDFTSLILTQPWGMRPILGLDGDGARVRIGSGGPSGGTGSAPVPEPSAAALFAVGALVIRRGLRS